MLESYLPFPRLSDSLKRRNPKYYACNIENLVVFYFSTHTFSWIIYTGVLQI